MDLMSVIAAVPGIGPWLPYVLAIGAVCAAVATMLPPPAVPASGVYAAIYGLVNFLGLNFGHARNIGAPDHPVSGPPKPVLLALLCAGLSLSACATTNTAQPTKPALPAVSAAEAALAAAGHVVLGCYAAPTCAVMAPKAQIRLAFDQAYQLATDAQAQADAGAKPNTAALASAVQAVQALVATLPKGA